MQIFMSSFMWSLLSDEKSYLAGSITNSRHLFPPAPPGLSKKQNSKERSLP